MTKGASPGICVLKRGRSCGDEPSVSNLRNEKGFPCDNGHACAREASDAVNVIETHEHKGDFKEWQLRLHRFDGRRDQIVFNLLTGKPFSNEGPR